jgi:hypothetical protein
MSYLKDKNYYLKYWGYIASESDDWDTLDWEFHRINYKFYKKVYHKCKQCGKKMNNRNYMNYPECSGCQIDFPK